MYVYFLSHVMILLGGQVSLAPIVKRERNRTRSLEPGMGIEPTSVNTVLYCGHCKPTAARRLDRSAFGDPFG